MPGWERERRGAGWRTRAACRLGLGLAAAMLTTLLLSAGALADGWPPGQSSGYGGGGHQHSEVVGEHR